MDVVAKICDENNTIIGLYLRLEHTSVESVELVDVVALVTPAELLDDVAPCSECSCLTSKIQTYSSSRSWILV